MADFRLVDAFTEVFAYTGLLVRELPRSQPAYAEVATRYLELMERADNLRTEHQIDQASWEAALFAVCAWVDEVILCSDWVERHSWTATQLQRLHFNTTRGGEFFFDRMGALDRGAREVREVYGYCLALGFKGRFFSAEDRERLERLQQENLEAFAGRSRVSWPGALFPEAGRDLASPVRRRRLRFTTLAMALIILLPAVVFAMLYFGFTGVLDGLRDRFPFPS